MRSGRLAAFDLVYVCLLTLPTILLYDSEDKQAKAKTTIGIIIITTILMCILIIWLFTLQVTAPKLPASKYDDLLHRLRIGNYTFILVHDCDFRIEGLETLLNVERIYNAKSTCYVRPDAEYFSSSIAYLQEIEREGWQIGFHYDCLSRSNGNKELAYRLFKAQLALLRTFFNVTQTRYHGDVYNLTIGNRELYDESLWHELGLSEVSDIEGWSYITDVNGTWREPANLTANVLVNLHSDWW